MKERKKERKKERLCCSAGATDGSNEDEQLVRLQFVITVNSQVNVNACIKCQNDPFSRW